MRLRSEPYALFSSTTNCSSSTLRTATSGKFKRQHCAWGQGCRWCAGDGRREWLLHGGCCYQQLLPFVSLLAAIVLGCVIEDKQQSVKQLMPRLVRR